MKPRDVSHIFNKFAGREVPMVEEKKVHHSPYSGDHEYTQVKLADPNDPTVQEMRDEAKKHGLKLRLWWPGIAGTMDFRTDRINAHIEKEADGKYRVSKRFNIG
jgi:hypothetical protein